LHPTGRAGVPSRRSQEAGGLRLLRRRRAAAAATSIQFICKMERKKFDGGGRARARAARAKRLSFLCWHNRK